jgi:hypothetical protein
MIRVTATLLASSLALTWACSCLRTFAFAEEQAAAVQQGEVVDSPWMLVFDSGKGRRTLQATCHPLQYFESNLLPLEHELQWVLEHAVVTAHTTTPIELGAAGPRFYDIFLQLESASGLAYYDSIKLVVGEKAPALFCPVYLSLQKKGDVVPSASFSVTHGAATIIASEQAIPGTGSFVVSAYFEVMNDTVRAIDYVVVLNQTLKELLPASCGVWKGGGFDIETLRFKNWVW